VRQRDSDNTLFLLFVGSGEASRDLFDRLTDRLRLSVRFVRDVYAATVGLSRPAGSPARCVLVDVASLSADEAGFFGFVSRRWPDLPCAALCDGTLSDRRADMLRRRGVRVLVPDEVEGWLRDIRAETAGLSEPTSDSAAEPSQARPPERPRQPEAQQAPAEEQALPPSTKPDLAEAAAGVEDSASDASSGPQQARRARPVRRRKRAAGAGRPSGDGSQLAPDDAAERSEELLTSEELRALLGEDLPSGGEQSAEAEG